MRFQLKELPRCVLCRGRATHVVVGPGGTKWDYACEVCKEQVLQDREGQPAQEER